MIFLFLNQLRVSYVALRRVLEKMSPENGFGVETFKCFSKVHFLNIEQYVSSNLSEYYYYFANFREKIAKKPSFF